MMSSPKENQSNTEEDILDAIAKETEHRLQNQREQNREAHQFLHNELERNARNDDDETSPTIPLTPSKPGVNVANSSLLQKFLNGDTDLRSIEKRDLRRLLSELESKYKSLMINNSLMYNEKQSLRYQIDSYKDTFDEYYEALHDSKRKFKEKCKDFDLQKQRLIDVEQENNRLKEILTNCQKLIEESEQRCLSDSNSFPDESIEEKLQRILNEKHQQFEEVIQLKSELDDEKNRLRLFKEQKPIQNQNINQIYDYEQQKQLIKQINDLKNRLQQIEADNGSLQQENIRYKPQLTGYKQRLDEAERIEVELKEERKQLRSESRAARDELDIERIRNDALQRENERLRRIMKTNRINYRDDDLVSSRSHSPLLPTNSNNIQSNSPIEDSN